MGRKIVIAVLLSLLFLDFSWSFYQYYSTILDGDMAGGIVPHPEVNKILNDPFGWDVIFNHRPHANPNRFFIHFFFKEYFLFVPKLLQQFVSPVESIYLACALIKISIHFIIVYVIAKMVTFRHEFLSIPFLAIAVLTSSCFQAFGYNNDIGIIDISITYTFFYALPLAWLLLFSYFMIYSFEKNHLVKRYLKLVFIACSLVILPFSGPLIPPIILISSFLLLLYYFNKNGIKLLLQHKKLLLSKALGYKIIILFILNLLCLYSIYLGSFDTQFSHDQIQLIERYNRMFIGFEKLFFYKSGFTSLFQFLLFELVLLIFFIRKSIEYILVILLGGILFSLIYLLLLPFGGYRPYRENILRYDTVMPITIFLFILIGYYGYIIILSINQKKILIFIYTVIIMVCIYSYHKKDTEIVYNNQQEKEALYQIARSNNDVVKIKHECSILSWHVITNQNSSKLNGQLLNKLGIIKKAKLYYYQK